MPLYPPTVDFSRHLPKIPSFLLPVCPQSEDNCPITEVREKKDEGVGAPQQGLLSAGGVIQSRVCCLGPPPNSGQSQGTQAAAGSR